MEAEAKSVAPWSMAAELEKGTRGDTALLPFTMRIADLRSESLRRLCI